MLRDGHWIIPHFAGEPRMTKPPGTGWVIAAFMWIFRSDAEWVVRLPAVLAAVVTALAVATVSARWFGRLAGVAAGVFQLTIYMVLKQARLAEADMLMCATTTVAMCAFALGVVPIRNAASARSPWLP